MHVMTMMNTWKDYSYYQSNVRSVAHQFSHRDAAIYPTGRLPRRWHAAADKIMQQSGSASDQQRRVRACSIDTLLYTWLPRLYSPHWIQVVTIRWPQCARPELARYHEHEAYCQAASFYKVQYEHIKWDVKLWWTVYTCSFQIHCGMFLPQELAKSDDIWQRYHKNINGDFFLRHSVYCIVMW